MEALQDMNAEVYGTNVDGIVVLITDGEDYSLASSKLDES